MYRISRLCAVHMQQQGIYQWNDHYPALQNFADDLAKGELYVIDLGGEPLGSISLCMEKDEVYKEVEWLTPDGRQLYPHRLLVHPEHQVKGYARALMDFAEAHAREIGCASVRLDTFSQNLRNIRFYEARGYQRLGDVYFPRQSPHPFHCFELLLLSPTFGAH